MTDHPHESFGPGVYHVDSAGRTDLVHPYQGGPYRLADTVEIWGIGRIEGGGRAGESVLVLDRGEAAKLKTLADAFSFDFDEEFIEMCHALAGFAAARPDETFRFVLTYQSEIARFESGDRDTSARSGREGDSRPRPRAGTTACRRRAAGSGRRGRSAAS